MDSTSKSSYEFGGFRFDAAQRTLLCAGRPVALTPKNLETLLVFLQHRERVLEKEELMTLLWPDSVVEENNLTQNISALRKALGEKPNEQRFIKTIPGRGYRFVAEVRELAPEAAEAETLIVQQSKVSVVIEEEENDGEMERRGEGETLKALATSVPAPRRLTARIALASTLLAVLAIGTTYWRRGQESAIRNPQSAIKTLAVLPFKSLNPQPGQNSNDEYLGIGLADVMITRLSNLSQLAVRPTSSVLPFGGKDALQAGQALKVDSVLDGSIQQIGNRVRVTVRLLRTSDGQPLWAFQCDEQCTDMFALQDMVSTRLTDALALQLSGEERQRLTRRYTDNAAAYQAYLKGRYHTLQYTPEGNRQAVKELNEALRLDPNYALAWAGLADAYAAASDWLMSPREALPKARAAAEKALALDDTLAEAHAALGHVFVHQLNPAAEREFQRAMALSPNSVAAMFFYGEYFMGKDADKGVAVLRRVQQLDPLSPTAGSFIASTYMMARRFDEAVSAAQQALDLDPNNPFSREMLGLAYGTKGNYAAAIAELEKVKPLMPISQVVGALGWEYALAGRRAEALQMLRELQQMAQQQYVSPFDVAMVYVGLGDKDQAFAYLEKAREDQCEWMGWLQSFAPLDPLRGDPRFAELVKRIGLAQ
ncbi:MAG: winged helix-turn-helix domain-containing protein [Acidobacteria bacterium]|nr:winged helix-turn-helix domain-containing protein [Acidobacteriota bacterium]MBI3421646.1 winged helix-turn-helix domain-containing protein [Acidobacteriota bacterium]